MNPLFRILSLIWRAHRQAMLAGLALSVIVALAGVALLGLSGWFITAAGIAGVAGAGIAFDVFRPSAGVRFLALGRTAARYGERLATHGATLSALAALRVRLLAGLVRADFARQLGLRGGRALNRLTADVDALDMLAAGLVFPLAGLVLTLSVALTGLWWLTDPTLALWITGATAVLAALAFALAAFAGAGPAARAEDLAQDFRAGVVDHLRARLVLAAAGVLPDQRRILLGRDAMSRVQLLRLARVRRTSDSVLGFGGAVVTAGALLIGGQAVLAGRIGAAQAALGVFAALALAEFVPPLARALAGLGRMHVAARRLVPMLTEGGPEHIVKLPSQKADLTGLKLSGVSVSPLPGLPPVLSGIDADLKPGQTLLLRGRSGGGKTSLLNAIAGLVPPRAGRIEADGRIGYLTQRPALTSGTIADSLSLAAPEASPDQMRAALRAAALDVALDRRLGEGGHGLSGGESRRLALARILLSRPDILLLDEPTDGLDDATARAVLSGIRDYLPGAVIVIAAHRGIADELIVEWRVLDITA